MYAIQVHAAEAGITPYQLWGTVFVHLQSMLKMCLQKTGVSGTKEETKMILNYGYRLLSTYSKSKHPPYGQRLQVRGTDAGRETLTQTQNTKHKTQTQNTKNTKTQKTHKHQKHINTKNT